MKKIRLKILNIDIINLEYTDGIKASAILYLLAFFGIIMFNIDKLKGLGL